MSQPATYSPLPGTLPARALAHFDRHDISEIANGVLADALGTDPSSLTAGLVTPVKHGLLLREKRDGRLYWRRGDAGPNCGPSAEEEVDDDPVDQRTVNAAGATPIDLSGCSIWSAADAAAQTPQSEDENQKLTSNDPEPDCASPAPRPAGLNWRAPRVPVFRKDPAAGAAAGRAAAPPATETTPEGAKAATAPVRAAADAVVEGEGPRRMTAASPQGADEFRCALWSDGRLHVETYPGNFLLLTKDETRRLVAYLDQIAGVAA